MWHSTLIRRKKHYKNNKALCWKRKALLNLLRSQLWASMFIEWNFFSGEHMCVPWACFDKMDRWSDMDNNNTDDSRSSKLREIDLHILPLHI